MKFSPFPVFAALVLCTAGAHAAGGGSDPFHDDKDRADSAITAIQAAVARADWPGARTLARDAVAKNPRSADYHNLYAYSLRMGPDPAMDLVFRHYNEALRIDPKHRGAHEYLGEAYLQTGNLDKAKEQLGALDKLCTFGCKEYTTLKKAVADYEARKK